jgi:hemerythrin-like metal-binding protein
MTKIIWEPEMAMDIKEIDDQHKQFIEIMREAQTAVEAKLDRSVIGAILIKLYGYAHYHFGTEEKYFALFHFEEAMEHRELHELFFDKVRNYRRQFDSGADVATEVYEFMYNWLTNHIQNVDRHYIKCFKDNGLK